MMSYSMNMRSLVPLAGVSLNASVHFRSESKEKPSQEVIVELSKAYNQVRQNKMSDDALAIVANPYLEHPDQEVLRFLIKISHHLNLEQQNSIADRALASNHSGIWRDLSQEVSRFKDEAKKNATALTLLNLPEHPDSGNVEGNIVVRLMYYTHPEAQAALAEALLKSRFVATQQLLVRSIRVIQSDACVQKIVEKLNSKRILAGDIQRSLAAREEILGRKVASPN